MTQSVEERIENEVRRRLQDLLSAAGVDSDRVSLEVLYWLPHEFMEFYRDLFERALKLDGGEGTAKGMIEAERARREKEKGEGDGRIVEDQNLVDDRGSRSEFRGKRTMLGGGVKKKYKNAWTVGDEQAFRLKEQVDRSLVRMVQRARMGRLMEGERTNEPQDGVGERTKAEGVNPTRTPQVGSRKIGNNERVQNFCRDCGKVLRSDYVRCPYH